MTDDQIPMRPLSTLDLLAVWEHGQACSPLQRALLLLAAACPEQETAALARLSIGARDRRLAQLRQWTFGRCIEGTAACPGCGERLEFGLDLADLVARAEAPSEGTVEQDGYRVHFRLPNSDDLAAALQAGDAAASRQALLTRCLLEVRPPVDVRALPEGVEAAVVARMAAVDPMADVQLALTCPACGAAWPAAFDIATFFWHEIDRWALRMLRDVHVLASAYGWAEADILALSSYRRACYLSMVS